MAKKIIVADDDKAFRADLVREVQYLVPDATIDDVADGESLVERVREEGFSLVLTDYDMGKDRMNGVDAIRAIRVFKPSLPIYMLSASRMSAEALQAGATGYISKVDLNFADKLKKATEHLRA